MPADRQRPTLRDVALHAGVSVTQASRALNDHADVAETTKTKVRGVAAELGYVPNMQARRLKSPDARVGSVGLILPTSTLRFSDPFFGDMLTAMVAEAVNHGFELHLSTPAEDTAPTAPYDSAVRRKSVDGFVIVRTEVDDPRVQFLQQASVPFVSFGRSAGVDDHPAVEVAPECMTPAVEHLVNLGHTALACLAEPAQYSIGAARLDSFERALTAHGLDRHDIPVVNAGFHEESGYAAARRLLESESRPTAIIALNDLQALGTLGAAADLGLRVPADLSVVGFDDIAAARLVTPQLTTLRQSASKVGATLIQELLPSIETRTVAASSCYITPELVVRGTTAAPPPSVGLRPGL